MVHDKQDFLVEIGTEELPAKILHKLAISFSDQLEQAFIKAELPYEGIQYFATPRRLAVIVQNVSAQQKDRTIERIGPNVKVAFDAEGNPTPAGLGFAKSCQTSISEIKTANTPKGECLVFNEAIPGKTIDQLAPIFVQQAVDTLPIPKTMRWGNSNISFVRPIQWLVMMFGDQVISTELFEHQSGQRTKGHRFHHPDEIVISHPKEYNNSLQQHYVIANFQMRKETIRTAMDNLAKDKGQLLIDEDLLEEVTGLVEWPVPLLGTFEQRFLDVPKEALISAMKTHQKSFPIVDKNNDLLPYFITVANIDSQCPEQVVTGNERVIRARLADAEFFFHNDLKNGIEHYLEQLKTVIFQHKLGTLYDKAKRISHLASFIAQQIGGNPTVAAKAGLLCKADLMTEMVGEFPELQGIMGYYYALHNNELIDTAIAIKEHYLPKNAGDVLPTTILGDACALADRLDTLVGIFGINQAPTGEKDPFGLRRAAIGILRILIDNRLNLDLEQLLTEAATGYSQLENQNVVAETLAFCFERLRSWYIDKGISADAFASVLARKPTSPLDFDHRIKAIHFFQQLPDAQALAAANKRVVNILKQTPLPPHTHFNYALLELPAEKELADIIEQQSQKVEELCRDFLYQDALTLLATLRAPIDRFFDEVMVMVDDESLRHNRIILLNNLRQLFLQIADISFLQQDNR